MFSESKARKSMSLCDIRGNWMALGDCDRGYGMLTSELD